MSRLFRLNGSTRVFHIQVPKLIFTLILFLFQFSLSAQEPKVKLAYYEGVVNLGYVDNGLFLNFGGANLNLNINDSKILLGMFPSLRFKEDKGEPKNSFITPALGIGVSYMYKRLALHLPLYYNSKTSKENGKWNLGIGIGFKISGINKN
jgi:hypothetical protein